MAETTRAFEAPGIGRGGIFVVVLVILLLISLFFIPEIIEFQRSFSKSKTVKQSPTAEHTSAVTRAATESPREQAASTIEAPSALDSLSLYLDKKHSETSETKKTELKPSAVPDELHASMESFPKIDNARPNGPVNTSSNFESIQGQTSKDALTKARGTALALTRNVPEQQNKTRYALLNFANGVSLVLEHATELFSPQQAISYITNLDQSVSRAMTMENVDREIMIAWSKVDLGPAVPMSDQRPGVPPFNPRLTLTYVNLTQQSRDGSPDPRSLLRVETGGFVLGNDITLIELVDIHGTLEQTLQLSSPTPKGGYRLFSFSRWANLPITIQIHDRYGNVYQKSYDFYSAENELPFNSRENKFVLPYRFSYPVVGKFAPWDVDPRVDARFLIKVWHGTETQLQVGYNAYGRLAQSLDGQLFSLF